MQQVARASRIEVVEIGQLPVRRLILHIKMTAKLLSRGWLYTDTRQVRAADSPGSVIMVVNKNSSTPSQLVKPKDVPPSPNSLACHLGPAEPRRLPVIPYRDDTFRCTAVRSLQNFFSLANYLARRTITNNLRRSLPLPTVSGSFGDIIRRRFWRYFCRSSAAMRFRYSGFRL